MSSKRSRSQLPPPHFFAAGSQALCLESTLASLPLQEFQVDAAHTGAEVARMFEKHPTLTGVILLEKGQFLGLVSRRQLLEFLIHPRGMALFLPSTLSILYSYTRSEALVLAAETPILTAAQLALRRSPDQQAEPIVVQLDSHTYRLLDVHELNIAYWQIRGIETQVRYERTQIQMIQTEKMASLGRLVDGVAHEILDPVGFIWGNLTHLSTYTDQVMQLLAVYEQHFPDLPPAVTVLQADIELDYLREDLPQTIASIRSGAERLKNLVTSLQNFCHVDDVYPKPADIHECLDSILLLLKSRLSSKIEVVKNYGHLPPVSCYAGQLHQVFMNILTNAINVLLDQAVRQGLVDEFGESTGLKISEQRPQITLTTQVRSAPNDINVNPSSRWVTVRIADNGPGISAEKYQQILDSFSVETRADKETSLAVSYQIVTAKHGGKFYLYSKTATTEFATTESGIAPVWPIDQGTTFEIWLPLV